MKLGQTAAIIVAAGSGSRFGGDTPKQYMPLAGGTVLSHCVKRLTAHAAVGPVVVVIAAGQEAMARATLGPDIPLVQGGATRRESVQAGLEHLAGLGDVKQVLIHDAARPLLPPHVIDRLVIALEHYDAAIPTLPIVDTLARCHDGVVGQAVERDGLVRVQTPQAFALAVILDAHRRWRDLPEPTDDASMVRHFGHDVLSVEGDMMLEKITHPPDFARAEAHLARPLLPRVGTGYDVHRLVPDKELWLCGVKIAHDRGLSGHSDADVAIHALVDAILGALAEGDIGSHFPPSDPQWRGAASRAFLTFACDRVAARAGRIAHADVTIICEAPKIGPHRDAMRMSLAEILAVPLEHISVKATTTERLGFTGRAEGIAAQAVVTLLIPDL